MKKLLLITAFFMFMVGVASVNAANLKWDAPTSGQVDGYVVEYIPTSDLPGIVNWNNKKAGTETFVNNIQEEYNLYPGTSYTFRVYAYNVSGKSGYSNTAEYTPPKYIPPEDNLLPSIIIVPGPVTVIVE